MIADMRIFLSYARADREHVEGIYQRLSDEGFRPWMDTRDIFGGEPWQLAIQTAIRESAFVVVCLSENSVDRRGWIQREIRQALDIRQGLLDSDIYLIPLRLQDCDVPEKLLEFQCVNLFERNGWDRFVEAIQEGRKRRRINEVMTEPQQIPREGIVQAHDCNHIGEWLAWDRDEFSGGRLISNQATSKPTGAIDASLSLKFTGTGVTIIYRQDDWYGSLGVEIDGKEMEAINQQGPTLNQAERTYKTNALGQHTLVLHASKDRVVTVDAIRILVD